MRSLNEILEAAVPNLTWFRLTVIAVLTAVVAIRTDRRMEARMLKKELRAQLEIERRRLEAK